MKPGSKWEKGSEEGMGMKGMLLTKKTQDLVNLLVHSDDYI